MIPHRSIANPDCVDKRCKAALSPDRIARWRSRSTTDWGNYSPAAVALLPC
ncbi:hypothetical protein [Chamaesiphon sp. OTE_75_metabat_556]|uniref:hypothetical protein n=1 Tax=Chamaesiphon sp. OTE_75_metabat_556 TaxID=2964692 RepID=UPI00286BA6D2|nr:hypothetical protein [Chamaesiphon sp. OTE_75_metabat_556]